MNANFIFTLPCIVNYINMIQRNATVGKYLFTEELLYIFRMSIAHIIRSTTKCNCSFWYRSYYKVQKFELEVQYNTKIKSKTRGDLYRSPLVLHFTFVLYYTTSSNFCTLEYDLYQKLQLQFHVIRMMGAIDTRNM